MSARSIVGSPSTEVPDEARGAYALFSFLVVKRRRVGCGLAGAVCGRQTPPMKRPPGAQGFLFAPAPATRSARLRQPLRQTAVSVSAEAIAAATAGRIVGERIIAAAVRAARPEVRNIAVDLGTIRWTDPKTNRRVTFATPVVVRAALLALAGGAAPAPFRFILGRATRAIPPIRPAGPSAPD